MTNITKKYKNIYVFFKIISMLLNIAPILTYIIVGFVQGTIASKVTLGISFIVAILLFLTNIIFKYHIRSTIWILLIGISTCLGNITKLLIIIAICTILDEFVFTPLSKKFKEKYTINKEIDNRG